jgi:hypothetical protein
LISGQTFLALFFTLLFPWWSRGDSNPLPFDCQSTCFRRICIVARLFNPPAPRSAVGCACAQCRLMQSLFFEGGGLLHKPRIVRPAWCVCRSTSISPGIRFPETKLRLPVLRAGFSRSAAFAPHGVHQGGNAMIVLGTNESVLSVGFFENETNRRGTPWCRSSPGECERYQYRPVLPEVADPGGPAPSGPHRPGV